jgi:catechol 2,3-dioxygenase-like lactoylglutathione lyase family enzyme
MSSVLGALCWRSRDNWLMDLVFAGAVLDLGVRDLRRAEEFYTTLLGRGPDLRPQPDQAEWRLHRHPEVAFRITADHESAGYGKLALGVRDLAAERSRLLRQWPGLPEPTEKPGVIALLHLSDPDANAVTLWQDLLGSRHA